MKVLNGAVAVCVYVCVCTDKGKTNPLRLYTTIKIPVFSLIISYTIKNSFYKTFSGQAGAKTKYSKK